MESMKDLQPVINLITHLKDLAADQLRDLPYPYFKEYIHPVLAKTRMAFFSQPQRCLYRARANDGINKFFRKSSISYNTQEKIVNFGRANEPRESLFYCSTEQESAIMEVSQAVNNPEANLKEEIITLGVWVHTRELNLLNILFGEREKSPILNRAIQQLEQFIKDMPPEAGEIYRTLLRLISNEFEKTVRKGNEYEYKITAAYSNFVYNWRFKKSEESPTFEVDGLLYPSVKALDTLDYTNPSEKRIGANLAIKRNVVDECFVLHQVGIFKVNKIAEKEYTILPIEIDKSTFDNRIEYKAYVKEGTNSQFF